MDINPFAVPSVIVIPDDFRPLDRNLEVVQYHQNLPHFRQEGATYFVTFRLADAIPAEVTEEWMQVEEIWARRLRFPTETESCTRDEYEQHRRNMAVRKEQLLDAGAGACWFREPEHRRLLHSTLLHFQGNRFTMHAFVIMPNHVHALLRPHPRHKLESIIGTWKQHMALELNRKLGLSGALWQAEAWDRIIRDSQHFRSVVRYIARNPLTARLSTDQATVWLNPLLLPSPGSAQVGEELATYALDPW
jgi:putative transposase